MSKKFKRHIDRKLAKAIKSHGEKSASGQFVKEIKYKQFNGHWFEEDLTDIQVKEQFGLVQTHLKPKLDNRPLFQQLIKSVENYDSRPVPPPHQDKDIWSEIDPYVDQKTGEIYVNVGKKIADSYFDTENDSPDWEDDIDPDDVNFG